jgi:trans-aconitate methyltransferase
MTTGRPRDWDAATYDRIADPMTRWGTAVVERLPLDGSETVLDAGCGSGRVTEQLARRLPSGRVIAFDASPSMVDEARRRLAPFGDRIDYVVGDLGRPILLPGGGLVDAILSTATFHWVPDHDALFRNLAAVLRPGGRLVAQCGGAGNIASIQAILATIGDGWQGKTFVSFGLSNFVWWLNEAFSNDTGVLRVTVTGRDVDVAADAPARREMVPQLPACRPRHRDVMRDRRHAA